MSSPPTTLGQYQIIREIARSNDIVYEAYDPLMNRRVAIKELMTPHGSTPQQRDDRVSRFKREAQAAGTLSHPNIMTVYSFAEDGGRTFMAMEYLDGQTLRNEIDTKGSLPVKRAIEVATAVLAGLEHAHSKGVIHRDIKPDNIQILTNGSIKITDFGIARLTFQPNLTVDGQVFGTPSYMSPEQVVGREIDARSDLFSVGVMIYEMLTGKKPFSGDSVVSTTYAIMNKDPEQPPNVPWPLWNVISRSLEKSPQLRYASAAEMSQALEASQNSSVGGMPIIDPTTPPGYLPATNPYAPALPSMPIAGAVPPQQAPISAPYNPYQAPDPMANPYAGQYPQQPQQPLTFPYNPYQAGGGGVAPHTPGAGFPQIPIYYPPPPRQPLFKSETILFFKRVGIAILIVGSLLALVMTLVAALLANIPASSASTESPATLNVRDSDAKNALKGGDPAKAEAEWMANEASDPKAPEWHQKLGKVRFDQAQEMLQTDPTGDEAVTLFLQSAYEYQKATEVDSVDDRKDDGTKFYNSAYMAAYYAIRSSDTGRKQEARVLLESAQAYAPDDNAKTQAEELLSQMHGL